MSSIPSVRQRLAPNVILSFVTSELLHAPTDIVPCCLNALTWLGMGGPYKQYRKGSKQQIAQQDVVSARVGFQHQISNAVGQGNGMMSEVGAAWVACAVGFELFVQCNEHNKKDHKAKIIIQQVTESAGIEVCRKSRHHEMLHIR